MAENIADAVSGEELDRHLRTIAQWVRLSGTPEEARAFDYIESELKKFGYDVHRYESDALIGYPGRSELELLGDEPVVIPSNGYSLSPVTSDEGVVGEVVYVGAGLAKDYEGIDARGKIVLSDGLAMPEKAMLAERAGAIGHIHINDEYIHEMCISPVWGVPVPETAHLLPGVPAVAVVQSDGQRIKDALAQGPVRMRLMTQPYRAWTKIPTLTADLPGTVEDRFVLFSGHVDSWHYGAMDNGTANATQLEVARLLAERRDQLRRGVRLAFWSGHSHGRYAGSTWYGDAFWHDLHERCVVHVNVDSVGGKGATVLEEINTMPETFDFASSLLRDTVDVSIVYKRVSRSSDQSFWGHGIPSVLTAMGEQPADDSPTSQAMALLLGKGGKAGGLGWWWHTTEDTIDKIDPEFFLRDARIYAVALWRLLTAERLPFNYARTAEEIAEAVAAYNEQAGGAIDLTRTVALGKKLAQEINELDLSQGDPERVNALVMELGRLLVPVNFTRSGPFEQDLALGVKPVPGLSDVARFAQLAPDSDDYRFLQTKMVRERNRVEHALRAGLRAVAAYRAG